MPIVIDSWHGVVMAAVFQIWHASPDFPAISGKLCLRFPSVHVNYLEGETNITKMASNTNREDDSNPRKKFEDVCRELNMDGETSEEAWKSYEKIKTNYSLEVCCWTVYFVVTDTPRNCFFVEIERFVWAINLTFAPKRLYFTHFLSVAFQGKSIHWLACALYVACRRSVVPTVDSSGTVEGNCVSLTRLIRASGLR